MNQHAKVIEQKRSKVEFSPTDIQAVKAFQAQLDGSSLPLGTHLTSLRHIKQKRRELLEQQGE